MIVTRDARLLCVRCHDCTNLSAGEPQLCPICQPESVFAVDLVDALARQLELTSAATDFTDPIAGLNRLGDMAA